jgi:hypothetical protein
MVLDHAIRQHADLAMVIKLICTLSMCNKRENKALDYKGM